MTDPRQPEQAKSGDAAIGCDTGGEEAVSERPDTTAEGAELSGGADEIAGVGAVMQCMKADVMLEDKERAGRSRVTVRPAMAAARYVRTEGDNGSRTEGADGVVSSQADLRAGLSTEVAA
ncbi:hypothetical protein PInf_017604 [Phytophthora infestans]|nr:hypothetical protein PInf_017604 [Phytophthora infestans]